MSHIEDSTLLLLLAYSVISKDWTEEDRSGRSTSDAIIMRQLLGFLWRLFSLGSLYLSQCLRQQALGKIQHVPTDNGRKDKQRSGRSRLQSQFLQALAKHSVSPALKQRCHSFYRAVILLGCLAMPFLNQVDMSDLSLYRASLDSYQDISSVIIWHI